MEELKYSIGEKVMFSGFYIICRRNGERLDVTKLEKGQRFPVLERRDDYYVFYPERY